MRVEPRYKKGDRIGGRYQVHKALLGGMGEVYLCLDLEENYPYALKTFRQRYLTDGQRLRRAFEQEVATWVALEKHPNIVRCFYMDTLDKQPFMVLEWVAGEEGRGTDLRSWLRRGPLDLKLALEIAIDICSGLIHAQTKRPGLVHRDLKPENILMAQGGLAKITDFGLAQIVQAAGLEVVQESATADSRQSFVGGKGIAGTPAYMAPEQWRGEALDERTDIYALGCILYELLTGSSPFAIDLPMSTPDRVAVWLRSLQQAHEQGPIVSLPGVLPRSVNELVQRCLAKAPTARYTHVADLLGQLSVVYQAQFAQPPPSRPAPDGFTVADYNNRGVTYAALGQHEAALADFPQALTLDPTYAKAYYNRGVTYAALGQREAALADYTQAITLDPQDAKIYSNRGATYADLGQHEAALADFTHALTLDPIYAQAYNNRGNTYADLGQHEAALADYTQALTLDPTATLAYYNRGVTYTALGQHQAALGDYTQALTLDPAYVKAYIGRGMTYVNLGKSEAALADYTQALTLDPTHAKVYFNRGMIWADLGQREAALADYSQALSLDPGDAKVYSNRGVLYAELGEPTAALADYTQALTLDPTFTQAYFNRGVTYADLGQQAAALADFTQALALDPEYIQAYFNRGLTYKVLEQREAALADYTQALTLDPTFTQAYFNRGLTYVALEQQDAALADFTQALTLDPTDAKAYYNRGNTYADLGQREAALADFIQALTLDPNYASAYQNIGALLGNEGRLAEALPYFEKAAQLGDPRGAQYAARVRQRLDLPPPPTTNPVQQAFAAFEQANSMETMQQAVARFPVLLQADFIAAIEQAIAQQVAPEHRPAFNQRLAWLRQIADAQNARRNA